MLRSFLPLLLLAFSGTPAFAQPAGRLALDYRAVAGMIVERLALEPGERVLLLTEPGRFEELVPHLRYAVAAAGGVDLGAFNIRPNPDLDGWDPAVLARSDSSARAAYRTMFAGVDAAVMMPGPQPVDPAYAALQDLLREGQGRTIHFHWDASGSAVALPGQPLPSEADIDAVYQRALLETDYDALENVIRGFEEALRGAEVRVTTPAGTDLRFQVGDRPVNRQDGVASAARMEEAAILIDREIELPAGVARVAPLEETVHGVIAFPPSQWNGRPVEGLMLLFEAGRVVEVNAVAGAEHAHTEMQDAGEGGRAFREFALGFNPLLAVPETNPWIPYYGYGAGVVRLSLGDNSELGGTVGGGYVRWNFFTDATVTVGEDIWVQDGLLVHE